MNPLERELMEMKGMNISRDGVFFVLLIAFFSCVLHTKSCLCRGLEGRRRRDVVGVDCGAAQPGEALWNEYPPWHFLPPLHLHVHRRLGFVPRQMPRCEKRAAFG